MDQDRRRLLKAAVAAALAPQAAALGLLAPAPARAAVNGTTPVNVIVPPSFAPPIEGDAARSYQDRLALATLDFVREHYASRPLPVWGKPLSQVDLDKRVHNIAYWILDGVRRAREVYPVDPAWVMGQIMAESFFYEFAVSHAFAVGVCQFIAPTARDFGMLTAGDREEHGRPPHKLPEMAGEIRRYYTAREKWKTALRAKRALIENEEEMLLAALKALISGGKLAKAKEYVAAMDKEGALSRQVQEARRNFRGYLEANFAGRDIFSEDDLHYLRGFDERVTYSKPIRAMALMLARNLRARSGNIVAAAAGYNAGLASTADDSPVYGPYGRIPSFEETVNYVSRLFVNHHEIVRRM
ncbi:MAG: transglycosylase SLT domain-containing protein [Thermodesulfobacteriota bacterium]